MAGFNFLSQQKRADTRIKRWGTTGRIVRNDVPRLVYVAIREQSWKERRGELYAPGSKVGVISAYENATPPDKDAEDFLVTFVKNTDTVDKFYIIRTVNHLGPAGIPVLFEVELQETGPQTIPPDP